MKIKNIKTQTIILKDSEVPLYWKKWFEMIKRAGYNAEIPIDGLFSPDWTIMRLDPQFNVDIMKNYFDFCKEYY